MKKIKSAIFLQLLLWILFIIFPLGQLTRLPLNLPGINIYLHDLVIVLILLTILKSYTRLQCLLLPIKAAFIFLLIAFVSWLININRWGIKDSLLGSLYLLRWFAYVSVYFAVNRLIKRSRNIRGEIVKLMIASGSLIAIFGLIQYFYYPDFRSMTIFGWDPHMYRIVATFYDPGFTGMIYVLTLILIVVYYWHKITRPSFKFSFLPLLIYTALALTYARSAYLALLVATGIIGWKKHALKFFLLCISLFLFTLPLLPRRPGIGSKLERTDTVWARVQNWKNSLDIALTSPVLGVGFNNYRLAQRKRDVLTDQWLRSHSGSGSDSSLLFILATSGTLGLATYLYFLFFVLKLARKNHSSTGLVLLATTWSLLCHSLFNNSFFYPWIMIWWWAVLGLIPD